MPRLNHRKAKTGCTRCKARKVKCDELKPKCSACDRHGVACDYTQSSPHVAEPQQALPSPPQDNVASPGWNSPDFHQLDHKLELKLMHEWTSYVCQSISTAWEYWRFKAPLIGFEFRYAMDSILSLAALHAARPTRPKVVNVQGHMVALNDPMFAEREPAQSSFLWKMHPNYPNGPAPSPQSQIKDEGPARNSEMLVISRMYFDRAIDGYRKALTNLTVENIEAVYVTAILVSFISLFTLYDSEEVDPNTQLLDPMLWVNLSDGTRMICRKWAELVGPNWMIQSGAFYGKPDLGDNEELYRIDHAVPFWKLLTFAQEFENMSAEDKEVYQNSLSYIGLMHKCVVEKSELPLASSRRLLALPARLPDKFIQFMKEKQPRATVVLAYGFAIMKLIEDDVQWFKGVAQKQIPRMYNEVPVGWQGMMRWPMAIARGEANEGATAALLRELHA